MDLFLDFEKAFDMIWHKGLLIKLKKLGLNGNIFEWIKDFITNRTIQVKIGNTLSGVFPLDNGTAQGAVISPILFICMIDDLPSVLTNVESSLFADDTAVYKSGRSIDHLNTTMQNNLANIQKWCDQWGSRLSLDKTVAILFSHAIKDHKINLNLGPKQIKIVDSVKFLGVILDKKLNWNEHIQYIQSKCKKRINLMKAISGSTWGASTKALLKSL